jgi:hypothetical protein
MHSIIIRIIILSVFALLTLFHEHEVRKIGNEVITIHSKIDTQSYNCVPMAEDPTTKT